MPDTHTRTQHTPGPWNYGSSMASFNVWSGGNGPFALESKYICRSDREGDARLIAAAPMLLDALKDATAWLEDLLYEPPCAVDEANRDAVADAINNCRAAIAKARGEE